MHYKIGPIRWALRHFIIGKTATAISAMAVLVLLGKVLPKLDYAVYVSMQAVILVIGSLTSFGINQSLIRYAPELRAANNNLPLYRRLLSSLASRCAIIGVGLVGAWITITWWSAQLQIAAAPDLLLIYLGVGWARLVGLFLSRVMQSLLWQKLSQYVLGGTSILKLAAVAWLAHLGQLDLAALFWLELVIESMSLALLVVGLISRWRADPRRAEGEADWWDRHRARVNSFARWTYLNSLTSVTYGSAPNRLIAARFLSPDVTAIFGFADAIALLAKRFMPARLLQGMIKPVLTARYSETRDFAELNRMVNLSFRLNSVLLCAPIALLITVGPAILDWSTNHKYGQSAYVLGGLLALLLLDGFRAQLELVCEVVEHPRLALFGNLAMSASLVATVALVLPFGVWGIVAGGLIGQIFGILITLFGLHAAGSRFQVDQQMLSPLLACGVAVIIGFAIARWSIAGVVTQGLATVAAYSALSLLWPALTHSDRVILRKLGKAPRRSDAP